MSNKQDPFVSINTEELTQVSGGAARVASGSRSSDTNDQLTQMLTQIGDSIKDLARNNNGGGNDQMSQMLLMMMMMGGFGGGGGVAAQAAPPTYVEVASSGRGKKGW